MGKIIGGLWINKSQSGKEYISGNIDINGKKVKVFMNKIDEQKKKDNPTWSDYIISLADDKGGE